MTTFMRNTTEQWFLRLFTRLFIVALLMLECMKDKRLLITTGVLLMIVAASWYAYDHLTAPAEEHFETLQPQEGMTVQTGGKLGGAEPIEKPVVVVTQTLG